MFVQGRSEISSEQMLRKLWVYFCFNQYINLVYFLFSIIIFFVLFPSVNIQIDNFCYIYPLSVVKTRFLFSTQNQTIQLLTSRFSFSFFPPKSKLVPIFFPSTNTTFPLLLHWLSMNILSIYENLNKAMVLPLMQLIVLITGRLSEWAIQIF